MAKHPLYPHVPKGKQPKEPNYAGEVEDIVEPIRKIAQDVLNPALPKSQRLKAYGSFEVIKVKVDKVWDTIKDIELSSGGM